MENTIKFNAAKSVVQLIKPHGLRITVTPNIYLGTETLCYVEKFKYLGQIITSDLTDDEDMERERRSLAIRGNFLLRKFKFCTYDVKCLLFRAYCYQMYGSSLWAKYKQGTFHRLRICYNNILRRLLGLPPWSSASNMFVTVGVRSFQENLRYMCCSLMFRIEKSDNSLLCNLTSSDAIILSSLRNNWNNMLYLSR